MAEVNYVASDGDGVVREGEQRWQLQVDGDTATGDPALPALDADALLEHLEEVVWATQGGAAQLHRTGWNPTVAARFALTCAEHALGASADVSLPSGSTLGEVVAEAKRFIEASASESDERTLARLSVLATARRLRRSGGEIGDLARAIVAEDTEHELEATNDPAWLTAASIADAVLAAVEALRHVAMPRYVGEREEVAGSRDDQVGTAVQPAFFSTPWGDFVVGAEHESPYTPASHLAREASFRARESVREQQGDAAAAAERAWQAGELASLLGAAS